MYNFLLCQSGIVAFNHANPGDLFIQKADASTIGDLAKGVQKLFGDTGTIFIGTRHGEKIYETLMTKEERSRSEDMGQYYRVTADSRDLNYEKYFAKGQFQTDTEESYTSHNTKLLDVITAESRMISGLVPTIIINLILPLFFHCIFSLFIMSSYSDLSHGSWKSL